MPNPSIRIPLSEEDLQRLINWETFDWTFPTDGGQDIDVHVYQWTEE